MHQQIISEAKSFTPVLVSERSGSDYMKKTSKDINQNLKRFSSTLTKIQTSSTPKVQPLQLSLRSQDFNTLAQKLLKPLTPSSYEINQKQLQDKDDYKNNEGLRAFKNQKIITEPNLMSTTLTPKTNQLIKKAYSRPLSATKTDTFSNKRKAQTPQQISQVPTSIMKQRTQTTLTRSDQRNLSTHNQISLTLAHLQKISRERTQKQRQLEISKNNSENSAHLSLSQFVTQIKMGTENLPVKKLEAMNKGEHHHRKQQQNSQKFYDSVQMLITPSRSSTNFRTSDYIKRMLKNQEPQNRKRYSYYMDKMRKFQNTEYPDNPFQQIYLDHFVQSFHSLGFCSVLSPVDPQVIEEKTVHLNRRKTLFNKTVVLDLDETLIHCNENTQMPADVILPIEFPNGEIINAGVNIRPYAIQLLQQLTSLCEVIVFTASHQCYASKVLDYLDPQNKLIHHRLFRDNCVTTEEGVHIKDLAILADRHLRDVVLVDNAAYSFGFQLDNGIPIIPFYDNKDDTELVDLLDYIRSLLSINDVRDVNRDHFKMGQYSEYDTIDEAIAAICS